MFYVLGNYFHVMSRKVLVVGGAGYIGSHMVKVLSQSGKDVVVLDNLSTGHKRLVKYGQLIVGDMNDVSFLETLFSENGAHIAI